MSFLCNKSLNSAGIMTSWKMQKTDFMTVYPFHREKFDDNFGLELGKKGYIGMFTILERGTLSPTKIGDNVWIGHHSIIGHDCIIENDVTISSAQVAGHTIIQEGANIGLGVLIHQFTTIGAYSFIPMGTHLFVDVPPFTKYHLGCVRELNTIGLERNNFSSNDIDQIIDYYNSKVELNDLPIKIKEYFQCYYEQRRNERREAIIKEMKR